jgi:hypothetical protein
MQGSLENEDRSRGSRQPGPIELHVQRLDLKMPKVCACCLRPCDLHVVQGVSGNRSIEYPCCEECQRHAAVMRAARYVLAGFVVVSFFIAFYSPTPWYRRPDTHSPFEENTLLLAAASVVIASVGWLIVRLCVTRSESCSGYEEPLHVSFWDGEGWRMRLQSPRFAELLREENPGEVEEPAEETR